MIFLIIFNLKKMVKYYPFFSLPKIRSLSTLRDSLAIQLNVCAVFGCPVGIFLTVGVIEAFFLVVQF